MTAQSIFAHPSEQYLRPGESELAAAWRAIFDANAEQEARLREVAPVADYWAPGRRDADIYCVDLDDVWQSTKHAGSLISMADTCLDIGAGAGASAIYLSRLARKVFAVDPSPGMTDLMRQFVVDHNADRVEVLDPDGWPPHQPVAAVDVCLTEHVTYFVRDITEFLDAMEAHTRRLCIVVANHRGTGWQPVEPIFERLHGEKHIRLTGAIELLTLLGARGRMVQVVSFPNAQPAPEPLENAHLRIRDDYLVAPGSAKDIRLKELIDEHFGVGDGQVCLPRPPGLYESVISWVPPQA